MAKKGKQRKPPPLSAIDRLLYGLLFLGGFLLLFLIFYLAITLPKRIAFADPDAQMWRPTAWAWMIPAGLGCFLPMMVGAIWHPLPLLGNRNVRYGEFPYQEYAPVFSKARALKAVRPEIYRRKLRSTIFALVICAVLLLLGLLGLCPRETLQSDGSIHGYNTLNQCVRVTPAEDVTDLRLIARHGFDRNLREYWDFGLEITDDSGRTIPFYSSYLTDDVTAGLMFLVQYRARIHAPVRVETYEGYRLSKPTEPQPLLDLLPQIADDQGYDDTQTALLYQLFEDPK